MLLALAAVAACTVNGSPPPSSGRVAVPAAATLEVADPPPPPPPALAAENASDAGTPAVLGFAQNDAAAERVDTALSSSACNEQPPQDFLVRGQFLKVPGGNERAIQYRTDHYGYYKGFGQPGPDAQPPSAFVVSTKFMGLPVVMHRKVVPALACVEREIAQACADHPYTAHALAGIRYRNTYRGGEITNHAYGIAIDIDPSINTCCGCVPPWNDAPRCKKQAKTEYDRMVMPECWVHAFERYGFYWLGHDVLRDTMHFEFLGDPDRIVKK
ncbi:MAG: M15 family metallopeptidase [Polyangiaceae bacterium]|nr:M15 family metallopeptidase [Polyangiaceae bacterium]